jgi:hypothetical protein
MRICQTLLLLARISVPLCMFCVARTLVAGVAASEYTLHAENCTHLILGRELPAEPQSMLEGSLVLDSITFILLLLLLAGELRRGERLRRQLVRAQISSEFQGGPGPGMAGDVAFV